MLSLGKFWGILRTELFWLNLDYISDATILLKWYVCLFGAADLNEGVSKGPLCVPVDGGLEGASIYVELAVVNIFLG